MKRSDLIKKIFIMALASVFAIGFSWGQTQTFTASGSFTVPAGVTSIVVECWGAGGAGGGTTANISRGGGGGAGGAYAKKSIFVNPGDIYTVTVAGVTTGTQGAGATGNPSWFGTVGTVYAQGGAGGAAPNGGTVAGGAGSAASSIGDLVFAGGNGANGTSTLSGGGGGGAGSTGTGGNASGTTAGTGTSMNGGNGGTGRTTENNGAAGSSYGGGGSGAYLPDNTNHSGGNGARGLVIVSWSASQKYTSTTTFTAPAGVSSITVECWGAGGAGGGNTTASDGGGGGGGGAYSKSTIAVVPGNTYTVTVGTGGTGSTGNGTAGGDTWFGTSGTILAKGGTGGFAPSGGLGGVAGTGGSSAAGIGTVRYGGGNGGTGRDNGFGRGGPGGSSAGINADGTSGPVIWSTVTAAAAPSGGGIGGNGGGGGANGSPGSVPGGGGGGAGDGTQSGGAGASGQVIITWTSPIFYSQVSGDPSILANWKTSGGYSPANFITSNQTFSIQNTHIMTTTGSGWTVSGTNSAVEIQNGGTLTETFAITLAAGTIFLVNDGATLNHNVNSVTIFGGGESFGNTSTINYGYAGAQNVIDATYGNIILSGSGLKTISTITVNGILSMEGTATVSAAPTYGPSATLQYKGSGVQATGPEFPGTFTSTGGVIIDNPGGVTLNSNRTIDEQLSFINGRLITGVNTLIIGINGTITGAGTGKYVYGNLRLDIDAAIVSETFEIGDATNYTPVEIVFTGVTNNTGNIIAYTTSTDHPNIGTSSISPSYSVNRYWTLTNNGVTGFTSYDATFSFVAGDMDAGSDYNTYIIGNYNAATWSYPSVGSRTSTSTQATGLTTFASFQIGNVVSNFRSVATGNWNQNSTWEYFWGGSWVPAPITPTSANGTITILNSNNVTINSPVTMDQVTANAGSTLTIAANAVISDGSGTDITVSGTINFSGTNSLTGAGSFVLSPSATINIGSPDGITSSGATGNVQTASRTFSTSANYNYSGVAAQVTGNGLPATVNNLIINNSTGVTLSSSVTLTGTLVLTTGTFTTGSTSLTFHTSDTPISRTTGTIATSSSTNLIFGTAGNTGGASFSIPSGTFTSAPAINNLSINRVNNLTLNDQVMSVGGVILCNGPLNTNNNLILISTATQTALIDGSGTGQITGNVTMQRYLPCGYGYKYFSSPFQAATVNEFGDDMDLNATFTTFYRYDENRLVGGNPASGWVNYKLTTNVLNPMAGYAVNFGSNPVPNTVDVTGVVNNGNISVTLYNNNQLYTKGFNLIGNPYPSPINWDAGAGWTKTNIDNALYYFKASTTDQYGGTYSTYIGGISSDGLATAIIPSMQGLFIHVTNGAYPVTGTLGFSNSVRVTDLTHAFLKSGSTKSAQLIRLSARFTDDLNSVDPAVIYFDPDATDAMDSQYDALKLMNTDLSVPNIYSVLSDGTKLSINGLPGMTGSSLQIPLGLKANRAGTVSFRLVDVDGTTASIGVSLFDANTGINQDILNGNEYTVTLAKAEYLNRFYLNLGSVATDLPVTDNTKPVFNIYNSDGVIKAEIGIPAGNNGTLTLYNIIGKAVFTERIKGPGYYEFSPGLSDGIYIAVIVSGNSRISKKLYIKGR